MTFISQLISGSDVDPDWLYPDPDPGRIQVNKTTKFTKHLLIFKSKKNFNFQVTLNLLFLGSDLKNIISCDRKRFLLVKLCFSLILSEIPLDPDPDSESGSGSTDPNEYGSDRIRIHITDFGFALSFNAIKILAWQFQKHFCHGTRVADPEWFIPDPDPNFFSSGFRIRIRLGFLNS